MTETKLTKKFNDIIREGNPKKVTHNGKKAYISKKKLKELQQQQNTHEGGILPLATLLPLIFSGIGAAGGIAGGAAGIAKAVNDNKANELNLRETERHNKQLEKIAKGDGLHLNPWKGNGGLKETVTDFLDKIQIEAEGKKALKNIFKNIADTIKIEKQGEGLYLSPYK